MTGEERGRVRHTPDDEVVLVDDDARPVGTARRLTVHDEDTPLHLAFSLYLFDRDGRVLLTRRALTKKTWPGVWTNACCGHPRPGEADADAVRRRLGEELGVRVEGLSVAIPEFRYRAVDASGIVEHEICPVFVGTVADDLDPDPAEVAEHAWVAWESLVATVRATPHLLSPWAAQQVLLLEAERGRLPLGLPRTGEEQTVPGVEDTLTRVGELIDRECAWTEQMWAGLAAAGPVDLLSPDPGDLPTWLRRTLASGGKRLRPRMCHWGFVATGGRGGTPAHDHVVRAGAALEVLHAFALIHDDVMDESVLRRGTPAAHVVAGTAHQEAGARGDAGRFGDNLAILLGDLAHAVADRLVVPLPPVLRDCWYELNLELLAGQRADLTGAAAGRRDAGHARDVAALKSGAYTIERPLRLGAMAAGADPRQQEVLGSYGRHLGRAFAWRDDVLGVWGEDAVTGKPSDDDLREGKATMIWVLGAQRLTGAAAEVMDRVTTERARPDDVRVLRTVLEEAGVREEMERRIAEEAAAAQEALDANCLSEAALVGLRDEARAIAWRDA